MSFKSRYGYYEHVNNEYQNNREQMRKGERTKLKLLLSTIKLLSNVNYHDLTMASICDDSEVSSATVYLYFKNRKEIVLAVLRDFNQYIFNLLKSADRGYEESDNGRTINQTWMMVVAANPGLFRCQLQMCDEDPEFEKFAADLNHKWYLFAAQAMTRENGQPIAQNLMTMYALGGMVDDLSRRLYARNNPHLEELIDELNWDEENLADFITSIWQTVVQAPQGSNSI